MKSTLISALLVLATILMLNGCSDRGTAVTSNGNSSDTTISYTADIQPIFQTNCTNIGCHLDSSPNGSLILTTYVGLMDNVGPHAPVVIPSDPDNSYLVKRIDGTIAPRMPLGGSALPQNDINLIRQWIAEGAPSGY